MLQREYEVGEDEKGAGGRGREWLTGSCEEEDNFGVLSGRSFERCDFEEGDVVAVWGEEEVVPPGVEGRFVRFARVLRVEGEGEEPPDDRGTQARARSTDVATTAASRPSGGVKLVLAFAA